MGEEEREAYFPETFLIPEEYDAYKRAHKKHKERVYISKTSQGSQGKGIKLLFSPKEAIEKGKSLQQEDRVIQRYLDNPLLINNLKHDLRIYVLIASVDPLIAFINEEGLARFCTEPYRHPTAVDKHNAQHVHLTNYAQNKTNANFVYTDELTEINTGSKQTLSSYWKALDANGHSSSDVPSC